MASCTSGLSNEAGNCVSSCSSDEYENSGVCKKCTTTMSNCDSCNSGTECTKCGSDKLVASDS